VKDWINVLYTIKGHFGEATTAKIETTMIY